MPRTSPKLYIRVQVKKNIPLMVHAEPLKKSNKSKNPFLYVSKPKGK